MPDNFSSAMTFLHVDDYMEEARVD